MSECQHVSECFVLDERELALSLLVMREWSCECGNIAYDGPQVSL
jgi:hypothetical protein